jgi:hypothetical protein
VWCEFVLNILTYGHCKCRHWQRCLSRFVAGVFLGVYRARSARCRRALITCGLRCL